MLTTGHLSENFLCKKLEIQEQGEGISSKEQSVLGCVYNQWYMCHAHGVLLASFPGSPR